MKKKHPTSSFVALLAAVACCATAGGCTQIIWFHFENLSSDPVEVGLCDEVVIPPRTSLKKEIGERRFALRSFLPTGAQREYTVVREDAEPGATGGRKRWNHYWVLIDEAGAAFWATPEGKKLKELPTSRPVEE